MKQADPKVFIVDDDAAVRRSIRMLIRTIGIEAEAFASAKDFLDAYDSKQPGCLVLDVRMPGMSGLELQEKLRDLNANLPIIFVTAHGDVPMAVNAMRSGAVDFIQKPFRDQELIDRVQQALEQDARSRAAMAGKEEIQRRVSTLTPREREVMDMVVAGKANKVIAANLGLSERTVEIHRSRVMKKMEAESLPQLVQMMVSLKS
jgi:FixJ family two-component response regulator